MNNEYLIVTEWRMVSRWTACSSVFIVVCAVVLSSRRICALAEWPSWTRTSPLLWRSCRTPCPRPSGPRRWPKTKRTLYFHFLLFLLAPLIRPHTQICCAWLVVCGRLWWSRLKQKNNLYSVFRNSNPCLEKWTDTTGSDLCLCKHNILYLQKKVNITVKTSVCHQVVCLQWE